MAERRRRSRATISKSKRYDVLRRDGFRCVYCGARASDAEMQVDHKIPVARGGTNKTENLVTACIPCNLGKGTKPADPQVEHVDGAGLGTLVRFRVRWQGTRHIETRLWLEYEVWGEAATIDCSPGDAAANDLLRQWITRVRDRWGEDGPVPITWSVCGPPPVGSERMPPSEDGHFLLYYGQPEHPATGDTVPLEALPVRRKHWGPGTNVGRGGFLEAALGWAPSVQAPSVSIRELHHVARSRVTNANDLGQRIRAAEALQQFRVSGWVFQPVAHPDDFEAITPDYADGLDFIEAAGEPGPLI